MAAHDDALGGRAGRGRQPPPTDVGIKIEAPPPPERPWAAGWGGTAARAAGAARPAVAAAAARVAALPQDARRLCEAQRQSRSDAPAQPPPLESWPSEPLAATATTRPLVRRRRHCDRRQSPAPAVRESLQNHLSLLLHEPSRLLRKSLDSAKRVDGGGDRQFLPPPHATSRAVRHEMGAGDGLPCHRATTTHLHLHLGLLHHSSADRLQRRSRSRHSAHRAPADASGHPHASRHGGGQRALHREQEAAWEEVRDRPALSLPLALARPASMRPSLLPVAQPFTPSLPPPFLTGACWWTTRDRSCHPPPGTSVAAAEPKEMSDEQAAVRVQLEAEWAESGGNARCRSVRNIAAGGSPHLSAGDGERNWRPCESSSESAEPPASSRHAPDLLPPPPSAHPAPTRSLVTPGRMGNPAALHINSPLPLTRLTPPLHAGARPQDAS